MNFFSYKPGRPILWSDKPWLCKLGFHKWHYVFDDALHDPWWGESTIPCERCYSTMVIGMKMLADINSMGNIKQFLKGLRPHHGLNNGPDSAKGDAANHAKSKSEGQ